MPVSLTHSQGSSQSPFVNRAMFYNSPSLSDDHINNAEEPHLSGAMRLFLWFGLTVMVIVWQTIYSSNNAHRLQLFSDGSDCRGAHDWLLTERQSQPVQPPTSHFCLPARIMGKFLSSQTWEFSLRHQGAHLCFIFLEYVHAHKSCLQVNRKCSSWYFKMWNYVEY